MTVFLAVELLLFCEELTQVCEGLELESISSRVEEEHCRLFADLSPKSCVGFDDKFHARGADAFGKRLPIRLSKYDAEMGDGDVVAIHRVAVDRLGGWFGLVVGDDLVAEEVEVDPVVGAAALRTTQNGAIEMSCCRKIVNGEGYVERSNLAHRS